VDFIEIQKTLITDAAGTVVTPPSASVPTTAVASDSAAATALLLHRRLDILIVITDEVDHRLVMVYRFRHSTHLVQ
jgi:hypothetical protein